MYKLLLVCLLIGFSVKLKANVLKTPPTVKPKISTLNIDSSNVKVRSFKAAELSKYAKSPEFNYDNDVKKPKSAWDRFWEWIWEKIEKLFGGTDSASKGSSQAVSYGLLAAVIGVLVYIIVKMIGVENIFKRASKQVHIPYGESLENIHEITFDLEIEKATQQRNYKLAVRLLYLRSLKQLNDAQLIHWQIEKTNTAYLNELTNAGYRQVFGVLTRQFEYVWYGDFPVDGQSFQNINTLFIDFKNMLP
ncbi:uncharacterized protein DUF4129 [Mucilaginibacter gracilis]|uniref:Uncharacterized protein DUF4129 n=1 Tax=Mucilaginibacter gracilis TaxID=423350 RepID=A0A495J9D8_9SPHI|nr:DUF4129 domain-containing protein [Mucilaginibacter gracilis]RKR85625.1 uncharacterized protein DUF4129 [Mucilaginibacter gracilis]